MVFEKIFKFSYEFAFVVIFITFFFFTIGITVEHDATSKQLDNIINGVSGTLKSILPTIYLNPTIKTKDIIENLIDQHNDYSDKNNSDLTRNLIILICSIIILIIVLYYMVGKKYNISMGNLLLENIILFILIGSYEYYFFTTYALNYAPFSPSEVVNEFKNKTFKSLGIDGIPKIPGININI